MTKNIFKKIDIIRAKYGLKICIIILVFFFGVPTLFASTEVFFTKEVTNIKKGDTFVVDLKISSDKSINVVDGTVTFDKNKLKIRDVEKSESAFSLWAKEPIFNNNIGELSFTAGVPNGFSGKDRQILKITFVARNDGKTLIGFKDIFSVFLNDGLGTNVNPWLEPMSINIDEKSRKNIFFIICIILIGLSAIILIINRISKNGLRNLFVKSNDK